MSYLLERLKNLGLYSYNEDQEEQEQQEQQEQDVIYGYVININQKENKTLVLERVDYKFWKTKWVINSSSKKIIEPIKELQSIFNP